MAFNPFEDNAPAATNNDAFETSSDKKENKTVVVENPEGKYTVTLKGGAGFDSPWIVIHAADASDALAQLQDANLKNLIDRAAEVGKYFAGLGGGGQQASRPSGGGGGRPAHQQAPQSQGEAPNCKHGPMIWRSWVRKSDGKTFKGFFCTEENRDAQCKPDFRN